MRIDDNSICVNVNSLKFREFQVSYTKKLLSEMNLSESDLGRIHKSDLRGVHDKIDFFNQSGFRTLVFSENSKNNLEDYSVPKEIRLDVLRSLPNRKDTIQIDHQNCLKYIKTDEYIRGILCFRKKTPTIKDGMTMDNHIHTNYFSIDLSDGHLFVDDRFTFDNTPVDYNTFIEKLYTKFLVTITYLELTEVKLEVVMNITCKGRKEYVGITNLSRYNLIHVNSNWNTRKINLSTINVRGHYRLQPYGVGRNKFKFIYINPYQKGLIKRLSQKELVN